MRRLKSGVPLEEANSLRSEREKVWPRHWTTSWLFSSTMWNVSPERDLWGVGMLVVGVEGEGSGERGRGDGEEGREGVEELTRLSLSLRALFACLRSRRGSHPARG